MVASASDAPQFGAFLGYSYVRFNPNTTALPSLNANGGDGQFEYRINHWVDAVVDAGAVTKGAWNGYSVDSTVPYVMAGPRFRYGKGRFQPFVHALFGGAYATSSTQIAVQGGQIVAPPSVSNPIAPAPPIVVNPNIPLSVRVVSSRSGFAMVAGGGLDIKLSKHVSFRPIGADYFLVRLPDFFNSTDTNRNNFRYTAGFNFLFGHE